MKINKSDLMSLVLETIEETQDIEIKLLKEEEDKFKKASDELDKKIKMLLIQAAQLKVKKQELKGVQSATVRQAADDQVDAAEARGADTANADAAVNSAVESERNAKIAISAARDALKVVQKGGGVN